MIVLEITCQDSEVTLVPVGEVHVLRVIDVLAGIIINVPLAPVVLVELIAESLAA